MFQTTTNLTKSIFKIKLGLIMASLMFVLFTSFTIYHADSSVESSESLVFDDGSDSDIALDNSLLTGTDCCDTYEKPLMITFRLVGGGCGADNNSQDNSSCSGGISGNGPFSVTEATGAMVSPNFISIGDLVTFSDDDKLNSNIEIHLNVDQEVIEMHTSCSQPLVIGERFGSLELVSYTDKNGLNCGDIPPPPPPPTGCAELLVDFDGDCNDGPDSFSPTVTADCIGHVSDLEPTEGPGPASCDKGIICIESANTDWDFTITSSGNLTISYLQAEFLYPINMPTAGGSGNGSHCPGMFDYRVKFFVDNNLIESVSGSISADVITPVNIVPSSEINVSNGQVFKVVIEGLESSSSCDLFELAGLEVYGCCGQGPVCDGSITGIKIYDQATDAPAPGIPMLTNGVKIDLSDLPANYYLAAEIDGNLTSVELTLNGLSQNCENHVPFTFPNGANDANDGGWNGGVGDYTLNVRAYAEDDCAGEICDEVTVNFEILQDCVDFSVDAGPDESICKGEEVTLSATVTGATQCDCCVRAVSNTDHCNNSNYYVLWLDGVHYRGNNDLVWEECGDGTARLTGTATKDGTTFEIDITYTGYSTSPPAGSPKENNCSSTNTSGWFYYTGLVGTLTNGSNVWTLERRGPSFQVGNGANVTATGYGGSGWFTATKGSQELVGDINIMLSQNCSSGAGCSSQSINGMTYLGAYGNSHYYMKTDGDLDYDDAKSFVQSRGGNLPKIETAGENEWLASQINGSIWLGLSDYANEGTWVWYDGEEAIYTNWASGEPSNNSNEDFARMRPDG